jgi:hypothetical protein
MDVPKDLGQRIVEAARLAVALHLQHSLRPQPNPGGAGHYFGGAIFSIGGADHGGGAVMDDGAGEGLALAGEGLALASSTPRPATVPCAGDLAESEAA